MAEVTLFVKGDLPISHAQKMTSSSTRPPGFVECYVCQREFGSRSIEIHEPQCLQKWKKRNLKLPKNRRERTPSPPPGHPHLASLLQTVMSPTVAYASNSDPDEISTSWSHPRSTAPSHHPDGRPRSASFSEGSRRKRPSTATLVKPKVRPTTMRLPRPSRHIVVPVITSQNSRPSKKTSSLRSFLPRGRRRQLEEVFTGPKHKIKIPEPCKTCGKEQNPERFHSHPLHMQKFKAKADEKKSKNANKMIVTKPTALRYKSKNLDEEKKNANRKNKLKPSLGSNRKSRSVESSPKPPKKGDTKEDPVTLKKFIKDQKASINKKEKNFNVEIYEGEVAVTPRSDTENSPANTRRHGKENRNVNNKNGSHRGPPHPRFMGKIEEESEARTESYNKSRTSQVASQAKNSSSNSRLVTAPTLVCYICGREFGSRSLKIHQPQCLEKWKRENERLPPQHQRPVPEPPDHSMTHEEWNQFAYESAQAALVPCERCGRTFFPERLAVHQRGCKLPPGVPPKKSTRPSTTTRPETSSSLNSSMNGGGRPTIVCYICGREFGSMSIKIHEPQCLKKWNVQNERLPSHLQRPEPNKPETVYDDDGKVNHEAMAEAAWKCHLETLVACDKCGRTFFPDRLIVHQKACLREQ